MTAPPLPFCARLVGPTFHQDVITTLCEGDALVIVHEPDNPHDQNACAARTRDGALVGYLPKALAARMAGSADAWSARITQLTRPYDTWLVDVDIETPCDPPAPPAVVSLTDAPPVPVDLLPEPRPAQDPDLPHAMAPGHGAAAYSPSGRLLGTVTTVDGDEVCVTSPAGVLTRWPVTVVDIRPVADC